MIGVAVGGNEAKGSGKSHLLDAIELKKVLIDGQSSLKIVKFNFETFRLENEGAHNAQQISSEREAAWSFFENQIKPSIVEFKNQLGPSYLPLAQQCLVDKKPFWNSPEGSDYFGNFVLKLVHTTKPGLEVDFTNLSSGERVLMALVASIYKSSSDNYFPDVLLLDELDASLHPSMMKNMLAVIRDIFLSKGVKVILVTHSPTTIALSPENSIFVMNRAGIGRIEKRSRNEALSILTEGFATLEESLILFDQVARNHVSILTEGKNVQYLEKVISIFDLGDKVTLIKGIESVSGKSQLKTLFDFFSRVLHSNKVLFVWDCDASYDLPVANQTYPFIFSKNEKNILARKGIENLFAQDFFDSYLKTITLSQGDVIKEFDESRKRDFEQHVLSTATAHDYDNFLPLVEKIRSLLTS